MNLSNNLISQFVKATKDTVDSKKETIVYGYAIVEDGVTKVNFDGSDNESWTPVDTTVTIKSKDRNNGERVTVMIKDHSATIIGNTSSPAARNSDLETGDSRIESIEKGLSVVKNDLSNLSTNVSDLNTRLSTVSTIADSANSKATSANTGVNTLKNDLYYKSGDVLHTNIRTSGFVTDSKTKVSFIIPLSKPIPEDLTITAASTNGFILIQNGNYTHGSSASTYVTPDSYSASLYAENEGIQIEAIFNDTTNAVDNSLIGIIWYGTITFS